MITTKNYEKRERNHRRKSGSTDAAGNPLHIDPEHADAYIDTDNFDAAVDRTTRRGHFLTTEVTQADLTKYSDKQLEGRLRYYERETTFERNGRIAAENRAEMERTQLEINRRKMYAQREAERVFKL